jgi:type II secretory pathway pseudopilin PulG
MRDHEKFTGRARDFVRRIADRFVADPLHCGGAVPRPARSPFPTPRSRQRGFSLLIVFMLIVIMVGLAMGVVLATQQDLSVAGQDREQAQSLYAAEYAVATAKAYLLSTPSLFGGNWNPLLQTVDPNVQKLLCDPTAAGASYPNNPIPSTVPKPANSPQMMPGWLPVGTATISDFTFQYCFHNNADDPNYLDPAGAPIGDTTDGPRDKLTLLVIEAYGTATNGAKTHLAVTIGAPSGVPGPPNDCRGVETGNAAHTGHCN